MADGRIVSNHTLRFTIYTYVHKHFFCHLLSFFWSFYIKSGTHFTINQHFPLNVLSITKEVPSIFDGKAKTILVAVENPRHYTIGRLFCFCNAPEFVTNSLTPCSSYKDCQVIFRAGGLNYNGPGVK